MSFAWALEVGRDDGSVACRTPLLPDWGTASGWVRFEGIRRGVLPPLLLADPGEVEPVWDAERGAPYVAAARITVRAGGDVAAVCESVPVTCLAGQIADVLRTLLRAGALRAGETVNPRVCAHPAAEADLPCGDDLPAGGIAIEEIPVPLRLRETPLAPLLSRAVSHAVAAEAGDVPVLIPARVLTEAEALARATPDLESGGFLAGHLRRDASLPECFVEVTALLPARHTVAGRTRLTFTPDTWAAGEAALGARRRNEEIVGWVHFHPFFCRPCGPERRKACALDSTFFSAEDVRLHALGFGQAFKTALLLSEREDGAIERAMFGWRRGVVAARGFHELVESDETAAHAARPEVTT